MQIHFYRRALVAMAMLGAGLQAAALPPPTNKVVMTMSGKVNEQNAPGKVLLDMNMLEKLPQHTFTTSTPWDKAPTQYTGPLLRDVLAMVQARGTAMKAIALNDYKVVIPVDDAMKFDVILAHKIDGQPIPVRTKGPLFIIYPFDSKTELQSVRYHERSIWQLKAIEVE